MTQKKYDVSFFIMLGRSFIYSGLAAVVLQIIQGPASFVLLFYWFSECCSFQSNIVRADLPVLSGEK